MKRLLIIKQKDKTYQRVAKLQTMIHTSRNNDKVFSKIENDYFLTCYFPNENRLKLLCLEALNLDKCKQNSNVHQRKFPFFSYSHERT